VDHFELMLRRWQRAKELLAPKTGGKPKVDELNYDEEEESRMFDSAMLAWESLNRDTVWREDSKFYNSSNNRFRRRTAGV
jgi:hypothetical protein